MNLDHDYQVEVPPAATVHDSGWQLLHRELMLRRCATPGAGLKGEYTAGPSFFRNLQALCSLNVYRSRTVDHQFPVGDLDVLGHIQLVLNSAYEVSSGLDLVGDL